MYVRLYHHSCFHFLTNLSPKANILIDPTGQACLADFGFLSIISDPANQLSSTSCTPGGTSRWMSPELISPSLFGLNGSRTKSSDCYALGMVIYETLSGKLPFHKDSEIAVIMKVMKGEIPTRDLDFPDYLWGTMEMCWAYRPTDRPSIRDVLGCLWMGSSLSKPSTAGSDGSASASPLNHTFSSVSSASRPPAVRLTIVDGADNGEPDLNLSISPTGSNGGPTYQVSKIYHWRSYLVLKIIGGVGSTHDTIGGDRKSPVRCGRR